MKQPIGKPKAKTKPGKSEKVPNKKPRKAPVSKEKSEIRKAYEHYIKSKEFEKVKEAVKERDGYRCMFCGSTQEELAEHKLFLSVHHIRYDNCGCADQREIDDCITVCNCCHFHLHQIKRNLKHFADKSPVVKNIRERERLETYPKVESNEDGTVGYILEEQGEGYRVVFPSTGEDTYLTEDDFTRI